MAEVELDFSGVVQGVDAATRKTHVVGMERSRKVELTLNTATIAGLFEEDGEWKRAAKEATGSGRRAAIGMRQVALARFGFEHQLARLGGYSRATNDPDEGEYDSALGRGGAAFDELVNAARVDVNALVVEGMEQPEAQRATFLDGVLRVVNGVHASQAAFEAAADALGGARAAAARKVIVATVREMEIGRRAGMIGDTIVGAGRAMVGEQIAGLVKRGGDLAGPRPEEEYEPLEAMGLKIRREGGGETRPSLFPGEMVGHSLEDYREQGLNRGVFEGDLPGRGILGLVGEPIVEFVQRGMIPTKVTYDILIELNRFALTRGSDNDLATFKNILEHRFPLDVPGNEVKIWMLLNMARFMHGVAQLENKGDYTMMMGDKNVYASVELATFAKMGLLCPEFFKSFKYYWSKFKTDAYSGRTRNVWKESDLLLDDARIAQRLGCCVAIPTMARHFVSDAGVFFQINPDLTKLLKRFPLLVNMGALSPLVVGGGFDLVDITARTGVTDSEGREVNGGRGVLKRVLELGDYRKFFEIYTDKSAGMNTDNAWSAKYWSVVYAIASFIGNIEKNVLNAKDFINEPGSMIPFRAVLGVVPPEVVYLMNFVLKRTESGWTIPALMEMVSNVSKTLPLKPRQVGVVLQLLGLKNREGNKFDGTVVPISVPDAPFKPGVSLGESLKRIWGALTTDVEKEFVKSLSSCDVVTRVGLGGFVE